MRKAVLTSSEVSVLASMIIGMSKTSTSKRAHTQGYRAETPRVIMCTLALFLSGYAIQQRTLRDLRAAIRPRESRPSPKAHLPDRFRTSTTELADGSVVLSESEAGRAEEAVVVSPTGRAGDATDEPQQQPRQQQETAKRPDAASDKQRAIVEQLQAQVAAKSWGVEHPDPLKRSRLPVTRAERRRMIKEELQRLAQANEQPVYYQRRLW